MKNRYETVWRDLVKPGIDLQDFENYNDSVEGNEQQPRQNSWGVDGIS